LCGGSPTVVWEPQEAFNSAPQNFDHSCILSLKSYPESFKRIYKLMAAKSKKILKKPREDFNLKPGFFTETPFKLKKA
jgi:hypothetical protein